MDLGEDLSLAWMKYGPLDFFFQVPHHSSKSKKVEIHGGYSVEKFRVLKVRPFESVFGFTCFSLCISFDTPLEIATTLLLVIKLIKIFLGRNPNVCNINFIPFFQIRYIQLNINMKES